VYSDRPVIARLELAWDGTRYAGWQRQSGAATIQQTLEEALGLLTGERVAVIGAGRTDAGVHARGQVASFRLERDFPLSGLVHGTNHHLPADVRVLAAAAAPEPFHARRSALAKEYRYRLWRGRTAPPDRAPFVVETEAGVALDRLAASARLLVGAHDFAPFSVTGGAAGPTVRRIFAATWQEEGPELVFRVTGEGFLRGMVRRLVGTQLEVARGRRALDELAALLADPAAGSAGPSAPARGLSLERVDYPDGPGAGPGATAGAPGTVR
jgi:tRNA pseudouridine38-40 synthase